LRPRIVLLLVSDFKLGTNRPILSQLPRATVSCTAVTVDRVIVCVYPLSWHKLRRIIYTSYTWR